MLVELLVENYAVVEQARIRFHRGLNILTGETGSGKSIVVDSFSLLLGARASAEMIRTGEARARVGGIFSVGAGAGFKALLSEAGIEHDPGEDLIIEREVSSNGKSRAFVANRPVNAAFLRQLAPELGDIHGQNEQQLLFTSQAQRDMVDEYADAGPLLADVREAYGRWREAGSSLENFNKDEQEKLRLLDLWTFQRKELESAQLKAGEDAELEGERKILQNMTKLQEGAAAAFDSLYESPNSATTLLRQALKRVEELERIDPTVEELTSQLKQASTVADDAALALRDYLGGLEGDPSRLEDIEGRLAAIDKLKRKYGHTLEEVLAFHADVARKVDEVENATEHKAALERMRAEWAQAYERHAEALSERRSDASAKLGKQVEAELKSLAMSGTQFKIHIERGNWSATGFDEIEFLVSPNKGEELKPMAKIASGGELSRIALALKSALGDKEENSGLTTLVFDEVDAGVGGAAAAAVGKRLKRLSRFHQVICVTHVAQIAGFADCHFAVAKREKKGRVQTEVVELGHEDRAREIGRMLSGEEITPEALRQAEQLIQAGSAA